MVAVSSQSIPMKEYSALNVPARHRADPRQEALAAFNQLVLEHQDAVYRQAYWILGEEAAAEDAAQEAFLRAFRNLDAYNGGPFRPWILRITINYCYDQLRRHKSHRNIPLDLYDENEEEVENAYWMKDNGASAEDALVRAEERDRIMQCIQRLPPDYRNVVILVDLQDMDYKEAAQTLCIPMGTFKSRLCRARLLLQKYLS